MNFSKLISVKKFSNETISIEKLVDLVKNNPQQDLINKIRNVEYKSHEYNKLKLCVNCITPHGIFNSLTNDGLLSFSKYLYYDIDGFDTLSDLNDTKNKLINKYPISFLCKSVGGKGISFLFKLDDTISIPNDTFFNDIYSFFREILINDGFNIDKQANGLVRKMIISSDKDIYFNNEVSLGLDMVSFKNYINNKFKDLKKINTNRERKESNDIKPNDTFEIIPFDELSKQIDIETKYTKDIDGDFVIDEMNYYRIILPKIIKDGTKHKLYTRLINALYYINPSITKQQVYSYLYQINKLPAKNMNNLELNRLVNFVSDEILKTGEVRIKPRIKKIHFNKNSKLTKNQKMSMGAKLNGIIRTNKTLDLIYEARMECARLNIEPTQRKIVEITGLSIATIKRNWNKEKKDYSSIEITKINDNKFDSKLDDLNEDNFFNDIIPMKTEKVSEIEEEKFWDDWNKEPIKNNYRTKSIEDNDFGEANFIDNFIECINFEK